MFNSMDVAKSENEPWQYLIYRSQNPWSSWIRFSLFNLYTAKAEILELLHYLFISALTVLHQELKAWAPRSW